MRYSRYSSDNFPEGRRELNQQRQFVLRGLAETNRAEGEHDGLRSKRPSIVMVMADEVAWADFGVYLGGAAPEHPISNIDRPAKEGDVHELANVRKTYPGSA
jgi:hypothetical protein